jgi:hypothetical protein
MYFYGCMPRLAGRQTGWVAGWFVGWQAGWQAGRQAGRKGLISPTFWHQSRSTFAQVIFAAFNGSSIWLQCAKI